MVKELINELSYWYKKIYDDRAEISKLKKERAEKRNRYWGEASGTVDQKKDYLKAMTSDIDDNIRLLEAQIEYSYNIVEVINWRMEYADD